jgi:hypothetical protein
MTLSDKTHEFAKNVKLFRTALFINTCEIKASHKRGRYFKFDSQNVNKFSCNGWPYNYDLQILEITRGMGIWRRGQLQRGREPIKNSIARDRKFRETFNYFPPT